MVSKLIRSKQVVWEELDGAALLIDSSENSTCLLNATATFIWKHCESGGAGLEWLVKELARASDRKLQQVDAEVRSFVEAFQARGWLQAVPCTVGGQNGGAAFREIYTIPTFQARSLTGGPRRRPSPHGNSGPG